MEPILKSLKLNNVCYDIRGPVLEHAKRLEDEGHKILKLNIGNPAPFGFEAPEDIIRDVLKNLPESQGYCDAKGIYSARVAVYQYYQQCQFHNLDLNNIYIGNGVSELIVMATQALLNNGDEVLVPSPDYPLWTAAVTLAGGKAVHYRCDEQQDWFPDLADIEAKISKRTRAMVLINPNNPTGAVYDKACLLALLDIARRHKLVVFSDEIYDKILYDGASHVSTASLADDLLFVTFNGLSKVYRAAGFRVGWMVLSGAVHLADDYMAGLNMLASMRLCANVPMQHAVQIALGGYQSIYELTADDGRLKIQRDIMVQRLNAIPGISCTNPKGAMYGFAKIDTKKFNISNDEQMVLDLLRQEKILLVHGRAFNWPEPDHFRVVFLPHAEQLYKAFDRIAYFFSHYRQ